MVGRLVEGVSPISRICEPFSGFKLVPVLELNLLILLIVHDHPQHWCGVRLKFSSWQGRSKAQSRYSRCSPVRFLGAPRQCLPSTHCSIAQISILARLGLSRSVQQYPLLRHHLHRPPQQHSADWLDCFATHRSQPLVVNQEHLARKLLLSNPRVVGHCISPQRSGEQGTQHIPAAQPRRLPYPQWDGRHTFEVLILILLGSYLVDKWLLEICFDIIGDRATAAQELAIELVCGLAKFPMLAFVVLGKLRGSQPLQAGFFAFKADRWLALQLAAVCLAIPLLEVPVYSMRSQLTSADDVIIDTAADVALRAKDKAAVALALLQIGFVAPLYEEVVFRGFLLPCLAKHLHTATAVVVVAILFAALHWIRQDLLPLTLLGTLFGGLYAASGSLTLPVLAHCCWNLWAFARLALLSAQA